MRVDLDDFQLTFVSCGNFLRIRPQASNRHIPTTVFYSVFESNYSVLDPSNSWKDLQIWLLTHQYGSNKVRELDHLRKGQTDTLQICRHNIKITSLRYSLWHRRSARSNKRLKNISQSPDSDCYNSNADITSDWSLRHSNHYRANANASDLSTEYSLNEL